MFCGKLVEGQELVLVLDDLRDGLGELRAERLYERLDRGLSVFFVLGAAVLGEGGLRRRLCGLRKRVQDIRSLMNPAPLFSCVGKGLAQRLPEPESPVADREDRAPMPRRAQSRSRFAQDYGRFPIPRVEGHQLFAAVGAVPRAAPARWPWPPFSRHPPSTTYPWFNHDRQLHEPHLYRLEAAPRSRLHDLTVNQFTPMQTSHAELAFGSRRDASRIELQSRFTTGLWQRAATLRETPDDAPGAIHAAGLPTPRYQANSIAGSRPARPRRQC